MAHIRTEKKGNIINPQDHVYWYLKSNDAPPLRESIDTDVVVIGGGMAGLSAAQAFAQQGKQVVVIEQNFCGAGASGKSSGFITPNGELYFTDFIAQYGVEHAIKMWNLINAGLSHIRTNIQSYNLACEYRAQDSLVAATSARDVKKLKTECENLEKYGFQAHFIQDMRTQLATDSYYGGMIYPGSFGINSYQYCQEMKKVLQNQGVKIYEETPALRAAHHTVVTPHATIKAEHIIICTDRFAPQLGKLSQEVYQVQTFLMASEVLSDDQIACLFSEKEYMVWDTHLIYNYYRITAQKRLLLGGGDLLSTYANKSWHHYWPVFKRLQRYLKRKFPASTIQFSYSWPGLIGISKDIAPLAGHDIADTSLYYIAACTGLTIAAALGMYSAEHILHDRTDLDAYFSPYRTFTIGSVTGKIMGKKASFAISNLLKMEGL